MEKKFIALPPGGCRKLAKDFKVTTATVSRALQYRRDSPICRMLRAAALERGGVIKRVITETSSHENTY